MKLKAPAAERPVNELSDRELLEELAALLRRVRPIVEAAERHPLIRRFLPNGPS